MGLMAQISHPKRLCCLVLLMFGLLMLPLQAHADSQTHLMDTDTINFGLTNGCIIKFDSDIYLGDSNGLWSWADNNGVRFYNLRMDSSGCPTNWLIQLDASPNTANLTVTKLFESQEFKATLSAPAETTSTTQLYCGSYGKPLSVDGARHAWHPSTETLTLTVTHASSQEVSVLWKLKGSGLFEVSVHAQKESQPLSNVVVSVKASGDPQTHAVNATTNHEGLAQFQLVYGSYTVSAYYEKEVKSMLVWVTSNKAIGFDFTTSPHGNSRLDGWILLPIALIIALLLFWRVRK